MQVKKPIVMHLPKLLVERLEQSLKQNPPRFSYKLEYFYYTIRYLISREIQQKDDTYYFINYKNLVNTTVSNIASYISYMKKWGIIESGYSEKNSSFGWRLNPSLLQGVVKVEIPVNSKLFYKIIKYHNSLSFRKHADRLEPHIKKLFNLSMKFEMDYHAAREWINLNAEEKKLCYYHSMLDMIENKRFRFFKRSKSNGRINSNLSTLKKELRQFINGNWVQIDLKNSQPFLLSYFLHDLMVQKDKPFSDIKNNILYRDINFKRNLYNEFRINRIRDAQKIPILESGELLKLKESCANGTFYEDFLKEYSDTNFKREDIKNILLLVLYSNNYTKVKAGARKGLITIPYHQQKKKFAKVYPMTAKILQSLKHKDNSILPIYMQYLESYVFIDCIAFELVQNGVVPLTIHDSVIVESKYQEIVLKKMGIVFKEIFGVIPKFHIEHLGSI